MGDGNKYWDDVLVESINDSPPELPDPPTSLRVE
jgi:hypothetical protein